MKSAIEIAKAWRGCDRCKKGIGVGEKHLRIYERGYHNTNICKRCIKKILIGMDKRPLLIKKVTI